MPSRLNRNGQPVDGRSGEVQETGREQNRGRREAVAHDQRDGDRNEHADIRYRAGELAAA